jgi:hypothetical protein
LLPTAFTSLTDPCLPHFFSQAYRPLAGFIAMIFALLVVAVESYLTTRGAGHSHSHQHLWDSDEDEEDAGVKLSRGESFAARRGSGHRPADISLEDMETQGLVRGVSPLPGSTPITAGRTNGKSQVNNGQAHNPYDDNDSDRESLSLDLNLHELQRDSTRRAPNSPPPNHTNLPPNTDEQKRLLLQCLLLEAGILFHSIFIGMALSVATGPTFVVFLIAIAFHQSFEGLALGSRIAAIHFPKSSPRPWLMVLAYGLTTPIGQAIGLLVHNLYDPLSAAGLLMVGVMNAISSGLLLFAGLVQLLAEDFLTEKSYETLKGRRRVEAFMAVVAGALLMAGVGALA